MSAERDEQDRRLDENLTRAGRMLAVPDEPTEARRARWREPNAAEPTRLTRGVSYMRHHRYLTVFGAGTALAASLGLAAMLFFSSGSGRVEAATIFQSFRDSIKRAFLLKIENVVDDGFRVDGHILVVLRDEDAPAVAAEDSIVSGDIEERGAVVDLTIRGEGADSPAPGMEARLALAIRPEDQWLFVKTEEVPESLVESDPVAAWLVGMTKGGLFVNLDGLLTNGKLTSGVNMDLSGLESTQSADEGGKAKFSFNVGLQAGAKAAASTEADEESEATDAGDSAAPEDADEKRIELRFSTDPKDANADPGSKREAAQQAAMKAGADAMGIEYEEMLQLAETLNALFTGQMTPEQLDGVISWIERSARDVSVRQMPDGLYVLSARDFDLSALPISGEVKEELARNTIELGYRPATGIEYAAVLNVGTAGGRMRFEFVDRGVDDPMFDGGRYENDPEIRKLDLGAMAEVFGGRGTTETSAEEEE